jgi:hypothetical protein
MSRDQSKTLIALKNLNFDVSCGSSEDWKKASWASCSVVRWIGRVQELQNLRKTVLATNRPYYIQAEYVVWNFAPSGTLRVGSAHGFQSQPQQRTLPLMEKRASSLSEIAGRSSSRHQPDQRARACLIRKKRSERCGSENV